MLDGRNPRLQPQPLYSTALDSASHETLGTRSCGLTTADGIISIRGLREAATRSALVSNNIMWEKRQDSGNSSYGQGHLNVVAQGSQSKFSQHLSTKLRDKCKLHGGLTWHAPMFEANRC